MTVRDVIVIGGGPAGVAAATELARAGLKVTLCEQGNALGGAIHRQAGDPSNLVPVSSAQSTRWRQLRAALAATEVEILIRHAFVGVDGTGAVLIEDRGRGRVLSLRVKSLVLAVGGLERVVPRPGWHLPGVMTAGGMQVMMKTTGHAPAGAVLLAGSGPLLLAVAAQMTALGNPPVAILERSRRALSPLCAARLLLTPAYVAEAAGYMARLFRAGVPWRRGATLRALRQTDAGRLEALVVDAAGAEAHVTIDKVALHDGLRSSSDCLPAAAPRSGTHPHVIMAGDCREALGGLAAIADGRKAAHDVIAQLGGAATGSTAENRIIDRERHAQQALANLFDFGTADLSMLPDETILCQCEGRTVGDLKKLLASEDRPSPREVKLNGRFGMGACQGRFCVEWAGALMAQQTGGPPPSAAEFVGSRWPMRPLAIASLLGAVSDDASPEAPSEESD
ncbi:MAG: FAD-dependent oxidoreductase [Devosia sp.]